MFGQRRFLICLPDPLSRLFESAEFHNVEVHPMDVSTVFRNFDDYWFPFLRGQGIVPSDMMSLQNQTVSGVISSRPFGFYFFQRVK